MLSEGLIDEVSGAEPDRPPAKPPITSRRFIAAVTTAVVLVGVVLRFWTSSDLWLDEALTVNISHLPLDKIPGALKRDGAPPLFYVLLHFWMEIFGSSDMAVRSLPAVFSTATLPLAWLAGRRIGGRTVGLAALIVLAASPFGVIYGSDTRMYSLVALLVAAGALLLQNAFRDPKPINLVGVAVCAAALLYTHYWALYLVATTGIWVLYRAWRGPASQRRAAVRVLVALAAGSLTFVFWLPVFEFQSAHTGTPWAAPADFAAMVNAISQFAGGASNQGRALALLYFALAGLGLFGVARTYTKIELDIRTRPKGRVFAIATAGTLAGAIVGGYVSHSAFQARYASVVLIPVVLLVALGVSTFADIRVRAAILAAIVLFGLAGSLPNVWTDRTQAGQVASVVTSLGKRGDIVAYCPDQLGPDVSRLLAGDGFDEVTFPRGTPPQFVNWVDYAQATAAGAPQAFASHLEQMAGSTHQIWYVWMGGYQTYGTKCEQIETDLLRDAGLAAHEEFAYGQSNFYFYEPMELVRFVPIGEPTTRASSAIAR